MIKMAQAKSGGVVRRNSGRAMSSTKKQPSKGFAVNKAGTAKATIKKPTGIVGKVSAPGKKIVAKTVKGMANSKIGKALAKNTINKMKAAAYNKKKGK